MTLPSRQILLEAIIESGSRAKEIASAHDLVDPGNAVLLYETVLHVIFAGSAGRDLGLADDRLSKLIQARDKLAHLYRVEDILPAYIESMVSTRVEPAVDRARELLEEG